MEEVVFSMHEFIYVLFLLSAREIKEKGSCSHCTIGKTGTGDRRLEGQTSFFSLLFGMSVPQILFYMHSLVFVASTVCIQSLIL